MDTKCSRNYEILWYLYFKMSELNTVIFYAYINRTLEKTRKTALDCEMKNK